MATKGKPKTTPSSKEFKDPKTGEFVKFKALHKVKKEGAWVIMAEVKDDILEFEYNEFEEANPGFKKKLT